MLHINSTTRAPLFIYGAELESVDDFVYLGNVISKDDGTHKDIKVRLGQAIGVFSILQPICRSKQYSLKTTIQLYKMNSNLNSVFLYGSECWRVTKKDISEVDDVVFIWRIIHVNALMRLTTAEKPER